MIGYSRFNVRLRGPNSRPCHVLRGAYKVQGPPAHFPLLTEQVNLTLSSSPDNGKSDSSAK